MRRSAAVLSLVVLVAACAGGCAKKNTENAAEVAYDELKTAWNQAETTEQKVSLAENYLAEYPDTSHSGSMAGAIVYYRGHEMEDPEGAWTALSAALDLIQDPEQRFEVSMEALSLADSVNVPLDLDEVAGALEATRSLTFSEHLWVATTAIDLEDWAVADEHCFAALELATPDAYRSEYPDNDLTDVDVAERVLRRKALALANRGWALYNLGDPVGAFAAFEASNEAGSVSYTGVPDTPLFRYWGRAALGEGDLDTAIELLGAETLFGESGSESLPYLREAYVAKNGDDEGFDEFLWTTRTSLAPTVDDFELADFDGNPVSFSTLRNDKVTLLAFWFPT